MSTCIHTSLATYVRMYICTVLYVRTYVRAYVRRYVHMYLHTMSSNLFDTGAHVDNSTEVTISTPYLLIHTYHLFGCSLSSCLYAGVELLDQPSDSMSL